MQIGLRWPVPNQFGMKTSRLRSISYSRHWKKAEMDPVTNQPGGFQVQLLTPPTKTAERISLKSTITFRNGQYVIPRLAHIWDSN